MTTDEALAIISAAVAPDHFLTLSEEVSVIAGDSLDFIWCLQEIEKQWGHEFPDSEVGKFDTVGDIVGYMVEHS